MKVALVADIHLDVACRWDEALRVNRWVSEDARARGVEVVAIGGDVFERRPLPLETRAAAEWFIELATFAEVVGVYGNHDVENSLAVMNRLESVHPITIYDRPAVHVTRSGLAVGCIPWPRKANLLASLDRPVSSEESSGMVRDCLRAIFLGLRNELAAHDGPRMGLAHAMISGAKTDHDQPLIGVDLEISMEELALLDVPFIGVGHVHAQNAWSWNGVELAYPAALIHRNFGEPGPKGYIVVEFDGPRLVGWERVPTPCTPMVLLEAVWRDGAFTGTRERIADAENGAEVRFRWRVDAEHRDAAKRAALQFRDELMAVGAVSVKLDEEVIATVRARAPEIAAAKTLSEKLDALRASRGEVITEERRNRLEAKLSQLEQEVTGD